MNDNITDSDIWQMVQALNPTISCSNQNNRIWTITGQSGWSISATGSTMMEALYNFYNILQNGQTENA